MSLAKMSNLGPASAKMLKRAGIETPRQLIELGAVAAFLQVKSSGEKASLNLLYAIYGAIHDCHWAKIPADEKTMLMMELDAAIDVAAKLSK